LSANDFDRWWSHSVRRLDREEPHETARRLRRKLARIRCDERAEFVDRLFEALLQRRHAFGVALFLLEGLTDPSQLDAVAAHLTPLPALQSDDEESHLSDLIRILGASNRESGIPVVEDYLVRRSIGPHWTSVPWSLWPHRRVLFGQAWSRFLRESEPGDWKHTLLIKSFLTEPDAIGEVRARIAADAPDRWPVLREALIRQAGRTRWLTADQRAALERTLS